MLARYLPKVDLRYIWRNGQGGREISVGSEETIQEIATSLGVLPDHTVKLFIGVEGIHDINFLKGISNVLRAGGTECPDLEQLEVNGSVIFFPFGGSNLALWASRLRHLNRPEYHICDRDNEPPAAAKYEAHVAEVNGRAGCRAVSTTKREVENYLHPDAIQEAYSENGLEIELPERFGTFEDVPKLVAEAVYRVDGEEAWRNLSESRREEKEKRAKRALNSAAVRKMTLERLAESDPNGEVERWLREIGEMLEQEE